MATTELPPPQAGEQRPRPSPDAREPARPRTMSAGRVALVGTGALLLAALLNSQTLLEVAERQPVGSRVRSVAMDVAEPLHDVASAVGLDRPRHLLDDWLGRSDSEPDGEVVVAGPEPATTAPPAPAPASATTAPAPAATVAPAPVATTVPPTTPPPTTMPLPATGMVKVLMAGDSMSQGVATMLTGLVDDTGDYQLESIGKPSTGLTRPDYFDWPARLKQATASMDPEVVVLMYGGNDGQPIQDAAGTYYQVVEPGWAAEYGRRVGAVMDQIGQEGRRLVWIGTPNASSANFNKRLTVINQVLTEQAATRPWVTYVDAWTLFAGPDGGYAASLPDADGDVKRMRNKDGYHLTIDGYQRLADAVFADLQQLRGRG